MSTYLIAQPGWDMEWDPRAWRRWRRAMREQWRAQRRAERDAGEMPGSGERGCEPVVMSGHGHGRRRHRGPGPEAFGPEAPPVPPFDDRPPFPPGFGPGPRGGSGPGWRRGRRGGGRAGRGDTRMAILALLADGPRHGYQLIQDITERSNGAWRPSPGSIYPALSALQDEGLVDDQKLDGRRVFDLTEAGRAYVGEHEEALAAVFRANSDDEGSGDLRQSVAALAGAAMQVSHVGTQAQRERAVAVLDEARRALYLLLAEPTSATEPGGDSAGAANTDPAS